MRVTKEVIHREIAGEHILLPVGSAALKVHGMITLTESGLLLWEALQKETTEEELILVLTAEYDIDPETAGADVKAFLQKLDRVGLLERGR